VCLLLETPPAAQARSWWRIGRCQSWAAPGRLKQWERPISNSAKQQRRSDVRCLLLFLYFDSSCGVNRESIQPRSCYAFAPPMTDYSISKHSLLTLYNSPITQLYKILCL